MSNYKVKFVFSITGTTIEDEIDLMEDYMLNKEKAKDIYENETKLQELAVEWAQEIWGVKVIKTEES